MKRILLGTLVGMIIYFAFQSTMWMSGLNSNYSKYTPKQEEIMNVLNANLTEDGMYSIPTVNPDTPDRMAAEEKLMQESIGEPWAMIFYHRSMHGEMLPYILMGLFFSLAACLIAAMVLYYGNFLTFGGRFAVSMAFGLFTLAQGVLDNMNWWEYPWHFVQPEVVDLVIGWGLTSLWLAWYVRKQLVVVVTAEKN